MLSQAQTMCGMRAGCDLSLSAPPPNLSRPWGRSTRLWFCSVTASAALDPVGVCCRGGDGVRGRRLAGMLLGRELETARIERLLDEARAGRSGALVLSGEPGIGKTALLDYAAGRAEGMTVLAARGI